ncbi:transporter substrate-binding domain-containing protein [Acidisoma silvae]|uniref:Transporter substrate-binding domain-containing protein n=1 Tax=Acidisoma silvae TaxID=2802396 RepID=A0A964DXX8_9PROT|nr:transporter substrate-binding domain-containing protein [Acidisoma silvae]MCB8874681.1 transporter substrate-binding domain-containing protein [Acidisoma silvae]
MRILCACLLVLGLGLASICGGARADSPPAETAGPVAGFTGKPITVGVTSLPPFVISKDGHWSGMAIDLWQEAAGKLGLTYHYVAYPDITALLGAVMNGKVDVVPANITITTGRLQRMDMTQPWMDAGLRVMIDQNAHRSFGALVHGLWVSGHVRVYLWIFAIILLATLGLTFIDRRLDEEFPNQWGAGLSHSFYHVMSIVTSGKATSHKLLFGSWGRCIAAIWMVFGTATVAYVTSSVTSVMTATTLLGQIHSVADLGGKTVGVVAGTVGEDYAVDAGLSLQSFPTLEDAATALVKHRINAVIDDAALLEYYDNNHPELPITEVGAIFREAKYGFALPRNSALTWPLSLEIVADGETDFIQQLQARYLGVEP